MKRMIFIVLIAAAMQSCGSSSGIPDDVPSSTTPIITRVEPTTAAIGDEITIYGIGFSYAYPNNIVLIGGTATTATYYDTLDNPEGDEIEYITADVPDEAPEGDDYVMVLVHENPSNTDISITVTP